jgi:hypothetical protein
MSEPEQEMPPAVVALHQETPQSPMEALRVKRDEIEANRDVRIPLVGFEEMGLQVQYRLIDRQDTEIIMKRAKAQAKGKGQSELMFLVILDTIIAACDGFYIQTDPDGGPEPLPNEETGEPVMTYMELARGLGFKQEGHRNALLYVFGNNDFSVGQHGLLLQRWLGDTNLDIDQALLGE